MMNPSSIKYENTAIKHFIIYLLINDILISISGGRMLYK